MDEIVAYLRAHRESKHVSTGTVGTGKTWCLTCKHTWPCPSLKAADRLEAAKRVIEQARIALEEWERCEGGQIPVGIEALDSIVEWGHYRG